MTESRVVSDNNQPYDAQEMVEDIAAGEQKEPKVNVSADYEASKAFSVSEIDRTEAGAAAAEAATAPKFKVPEPESKPLVTEPTGDPADYVEMAKDVTPGTGATPITDDLVQKALDMGQPGH